MAAYLAELAPVPADDRAIAAVRAHARNLANHCFCVLHASARKTAEFLVQISDYRKGKRREIRAFYVLTLGS